MAQRSLRQCKQRWCKNLTRDITGYCEEHIHIYEERRAQGNKYYDKHIRHSKDKKYTKFYHSDEWEDLRKDVLTTYNGVDIYSYYIENKAVTANTAHHIIELKEDWDKRLDKDNIFPLTDANHKKIHSLYRKDKKGTQELLRELLERFRKQFGISPLP
ncbi:hypothetical protein FDC22_06095 [Clostridium botulinum]|uniref:HNH endonuclease n=1 Tax=Clostridium botulinum (strain Okra / Type B1) TaxID=498213 RepID=B1IJ24_CLOBK|nr:hypothetical protein [Clostridium botulinum]EKX80570.1 hypothetical protein CFSAN001628_005684 [Clostridium botulinum CFSAN001628]ACA46175.1 conserved hypothetical protein [Clostridium botulinum B1 str. Okra]MBD5564433.1 hypothetical protein [Clostridium botulinum]MBD5566951.1 hypothetical protein [Clostridium botulinum]MBD5570436.1 hypothetical protein [Clostridium botulinum]